MVILVEKLQSFLKSEKELEIKEAETETDSEQEGERTPRDFEGP